MAVYVYRQASQTLKTSRIDARIDEARIGAWMQQITAMPGVGKRPSKKP